MLRPVTRQQNNIIHAQRSSTYPMRGGSCQHQDLWARLRRLLSLSPLVDRSARGREGRPNCLSSMGLNYGPARRRGGWGGRGGESEHEHPLSLWGNTSTSIPEESTPGNTWSQYGNTWSPTGNIWQQSTSSLSSPVLTSSATFL